MSKQIKISKAATEILDSLKEAGWSYSDVVLCLAGKKKAPEKIVPQYDLSDESKEWLLTQFQRFGGKG